MAEHERIEVHLRTLTLPGIPSGRTVVPDYPGYSICGVPGLVRALLGLGEGTPLSSAVAERIPDSYSKVILFILDGLGFGRLLELLDHYPDLYLASLIERGAFLPITSVFPSTTVAALTTYATGVTPQEHGVVGYRLYLRETAAITNMIRLSLLGTTRGDSAVDWGINLETFLSGPFAPESLRALGVETHTILSKRISTSGLSTLLYGSSTRLHGATALSDMLVAARRLARETPGRAFVQLYWAETDTLAHLHGPRSEEFTAELRAVDATLRQELDGAVPGAVLVVSSDHGLVSMENEDYAQIAEDPELMRDLVLPPVGEPRAAYLFVRAGRKEAVAERIRERFGGDLLCLDSLSALKGGLFGQGKRHPAVADRIGDLVVVSTGKRALHYPYKDAAMLRGMHGGLTDEEMLVPLIVCPL